MNGTKFRTFSSSSTGSADSSHTSRSSRIPFSARMIRCAVLQETGAQGKQVLFDNQIKSGISLSPSNSAPTLRHKPKKERTTPSPSREEEVTSPQRPLQHDQQVLEMIFGTVPVSGSSVNTKIHHLEQRQQIMLSLLFTFFTKTEEDIKSSTPSAPSPQKRSSRSISVKGNTQKNLQIQEDLKEVQVAASPRKRSISFTSGAKIQKEGRSGPSHVRLSGTYPRRPQKTTVAIAVFIRVLPQVQAVQDMVHSHHSILLYRLRIVAQILYEAITKSLKHDSPSRTGDVTRKFKLRGDVLPPYALQGEFVLQSAFGDLQRSICTFMTYPRLQPAAWYQVVESAENRANILKDFILSVDFLIQRFDTADSGYLLSSIITALLAYHASWVFSLPSGVCKEEEMEYKGDIQRQISQLYGCISADSPRTCRVIVRGMDSKLVSRFLFVLSFFIRSSTTKIYALDQQDTSLPSQNVPAARMIVSSVAPAPVLHSLPKDKSIWAEKEIEEEKEEKKVSLKVVDIPSTQWKTKYPTTNPYKKIGISLFGSYCNHYASDFVTLGLTSDASELHSQIAIDLWSQCKFWPFGVEEYTSPPDTSSRSFHLKSSTCILVDLRQNNIDIQHFSPEEEENESLFTNQTESKFSHIFNRTMEPSPIIRNMLRTITFMTKNEFPSESSIICVEDMLCTIYQNSYLLSSFLCEHAQTTYSYADIPNYLPGMAMEDIELYATLQNTLHPRSVINLRCG